MRGEARKMSCMMAVKERPAGNSRGGGMGRRVPAPGVRR